MKQSISLSCNIFNSLSGINSGELHAKTRTNWTHRSPYASLEEDNASSRAARACWCVLCELGEWFERAARRANTDPFGGGGFGGSWRVVVLAIVLQRVVVWLEVYGVSLKVKLICLNFRYILELRFY